MWLPNFGLSLDFIISSSLLHYYLWIWEIEKDCIHVCLWLVLYLGVIKGIAISVLRSGSLAILLFSLSSKQLCRWIIYDLTANIWLWPILLLTNHHMLLSNICDAYVKLFFFEVSNLFKASSCWGGALVYSLLWSFVHDFERISYMKDTFQRTCSPGDPDSVANEAELFILWQLEPIYIMILIA